MARTVRTASPKKWWRKERTALRRASTRAHRRAANAAAKAGREVPAFKGTGGHLTW